MSKQTKSRGFSAEMITAGSAVVIGVAAVVVSLYEAVLTRQQLKGSAWPNIEIGYSYNDESFRYLVMNSGVGPARIQSAEVTVDGEPVMDWNELFVRLELDVGKRIVADIGRRVLPPDKMLEILILDSGEPIDELYLSQERIEMTICYCSVYDDCWATTLGGDPVPVEACAPNANRQFRN